MLEILKQTHFSKVTKIFFGIWLFLFLSVIVIYNVLVFMSKDRIERAQMVIESRAQEMPGIESKCHIIHNTDSNRATLTPCQQEYRKNEDRGKEAAYLYRVALHFQSKIFRVQRFYSTIILQDIVWNLNPQERDGIRIFYEIAEDSFAILSSKELQIGQNIGTLNYTTEFFPLLLSDYAGRLLSILALWGMIWFLCVPFKKYKQKFQSLYPKQETLLPQQKRGFTISDRIFLLLSACIACALFAFHFWLAYPGHFASDAYSTLRISTTNYMPVLPSYIFGILYFIFGRHSFYFLLFNLIPFYLGLLLLVWGFYIRFRSVFAFLLFAPVLLGNIFFQNFIALTSFSLPMLLFCLYALVLFMLFVPLGKRATKILWYIVWIVLFIAILWRHNAIVSVFPVGFVLVYVWLHNRGLRAKEYVIQYAKWLALFTILCLCIVTIIPRNLTFPRSTLPANHIFLHQIAAMCVPANDSTCFKEEWYLPTRDFAYVKELYAKYPLFADPFGAGWFEHTRPFPQTELQGLYTQWIKAIFTHPQNFLAHEMAFIKAMWIQEPKWIFDSKELQQNSHNEQQVAILSKFPEDEWAIVFTPQREKIYNFLYENRFLVNHIYGVGASFCVMLFAFLLWVWNPKMRNAFLIFSFSAGFAGFFSALIIALFTPVAESRYMSPVLPLGLIACIGFLAFILDSKKKDSI